MRSTGRGEKRGRRRNGDDGGRGNGAKGIQTGRKNNPRWRVCSRWTGRSSSSLSPIFVLSPTVSYGSERHPSQGKEGGDGGPLPPSYTAMYKAHVENGVFCSLMDIAFSAGDILWYKLTHQIVDTATEKRGLKGKRILKPFFPRAPGCLWP